MGKGGSFGMDVDVGVDGLGFGNVKNWVVVVVQIF